MPMDGRYSARRQDAGAHMFMDVRFDAGAWMRRSGI